MKYRYIKPVILALLLFTACNDDILEKSNPNELLQDNYFQNSIQLQASVNAIYSALQANQLYNREYFFLHDMLSDENFGNSQLEAPRRAVLEYNLTPDNLLIVSVWTGMYRVIHRANIVIANADKVPASEISDELRNRLKAEAHFLRGWAYFELVSMWGNIPLITEPVSPEKAKEGFPRAPVEDVYTVIFEDLDFAEANLGLKSDYPDTDLGRVTKGAARALKGKIHMWRGEFPQAIVELQKVIDSDEYELVDRYLDNFQEENENNAESIFEVQFSSSYGSGNPWSPDGNGIAEITFRGQEYTPQTGWRNVDPSAGLKDEYETGDPRYDYNFYLDGETYNNGADMMDLATPGWQKYSMAYKQGAENQLSGINFRVIRYADVLLMMAEAMNEVNNGPTTTAVGYVNQVRSRSDVNLPDIAPANEDEFFDMIVHERRVEFPGEQIRNRDIRRWRRAGKLDTEPIANYRPIHDLLPIPTTELDNNPALDPAQDQNPGY